MAESDPGCTKRSTTFSFLNRSRIFLVQMKANDLAHTRAKGAKHVPRVGSLRLQTPTTPTATWPSMKSGKDT